MPPLDFPASPSTGQTYAGPGGVVWSWDSQKWVNGASGVGAGVASFNTRTGVVTLGTSDVTGLGAYAGSFTTLAASSTVSGTGFTTLLAPYALRTGTTTNDNALTGQVGEFLSSVVLVGAAVSMTSNTPVAMTSLALTAGDWEVYGVLTFNVGATTVVQSLVAGISNSSGSLGSTVVQLNAQFTSFAQAISAGPARQSLASTTTVYLVAQSAFTTSTMSVFGNFNARRIR